MHPIIFNTEQVRAVLAGRKTQHRVPVKLPFLDRNMGCELSGNELAGELVAGNYLNSKFGKPGSKLWVRETWSTHECFDDHPSKSLSPLLSFHYWADGYLDTGKKRPSTHMPRWASRITLEITDVRVERLQAITIGDICKEGLAASMYEFRPVTQAFPSFEGYWESIHGTESWKSNPWVWVIEFKRVESKK